MMDPSSVLDAALTFGGVIAVLFMGISTLSNESTAAFVAPELRAEGGRGEHPHVWQRAA